MVQGLPAVKWTPENNAKLLTAIVTLNPGVIDLKKIAAVFGPDVPVAAISYRMSTLRKEGAALGIKSDSSDTKSSKRAPTVRNGGGKTQKKVVPASPISDEESAHEKEGSEIEQGLSPPDTDDGKHIKTFNTSNKHEKTISGRVTKPRISPRKGSKKDYKKLGDPFVELKGTTNTDGEQVFDTEKSDSEDSFESDGDYMKGAKAATIKMEEEI